MKWRLSVLLRNSPAQRSAFAIKPARPDPSGFLTIWRASLALCGLLLLAVSAFGATLRLYMKDGTYQLIKEYQVLPDRVKYLSAERSGEWEEIPLDLVDLNRTKQEAKEHEDQLAKDAKDDADEDAAIKEQKQEASYVPDEAGVYFVHGEKLEPLKLADLTITHDKKRTILKILSPIPLVSGKNTVDIEGAASKFRVNADRPEFYFRLNAVDGLAIIKLTPNKTSRMVETVSIAAVTNELDEKRNVVPTFTRQVGDLLFKIWPEQTMLPGEYAVIEYGAEQGTLQVWDFGVGETK